jgi:hypothetical protein
VGFVVLVHPSHRRFYFGQIYQAELESIWCISHLEVLIESAKLSRQARSQSVRLTATTTLSLVNQTKSENNNSVTVHCGDTKKKTKHNNPA